MTDSNIMEKIKKLLSLGGNNPNEAEANSALKKAAQLAEQHGLSISDIDTTTNEVNIKESSVIITNRKDRYWMGSLCNALLQCFECEAVFTEVWEKTLEKSVWELRFVGMKTDVDLSIWYIKHLQLQIKRGSEKEFSTAKEKFSYCVGAGQTIYSRLIEMFVKEREKNRGAITKDLVVVKKDAGTKAFREKYPHLRKARKKTMSLDQNAFGKGQEDGKTMRLNKGISN